MRSSTSSTSTTAIRSHAIPECRHRRAGPLEDRPDRGREQAGGREGESPATARLGEADARPVAGHREGRREGRRRQHRCLCARQPVARGRRRRRAGRVDRLSSRHAARSTARDREPTGIVADVKAIASTGLRAVRTRLEATRQSSLPRKSVGSAIPHRARCPRSTLASFGLAARDLRPRGVGHPRRMAPPSWPRSRASSSPPGRGRARLHRHRFEAAPSGLRGDHRGAERRRAGAAGEPGSHR